MANCLAHLMPMAGQILTAEAGLQEPQNSKVPVSGSEDAASQAPVLHKVQTMVVWPWYQEWSSKVALLVLTCSVPGFDCPETNKFQNKQCGVFVKQSSVKVGSAVIIVPPLCFGTDSVQEQPSPMGSC